MCNLIGIGQISYYNKHLLISGHSKDILLISKELFDKQAGYLSRVIYFPKKVST